MEQNTSLHSKDLEDQIARNQAALALLDEWETDPSGYEEQNADAIERALQAIDDRTAAVQGIRRGMEAFDQGRFRRFAEFEAEQRARYNLPPTG